MTLKKTIAKALLAFAISLTTLALFCINASAAAKTTVVLVDETYSSRYFSYEPTVSEYLNNTSADIVRFGKNGKTALYDEVQKAIDDGYVNIYVISDCWNTTGRESVEANNAQIILLTPYFESKDVDKHLSDVVEKLTTTSTVNVEYWGKWPKVKSVPTLEPETDPDEDLMYRTTEVDEDMLENLETLSDEKDVAKTANTLNNAILEDMETVLVVWLHFKLMCFKRYKSLKARSMCLQRKAKSSLKIGVSWIMILEVQLILLKQSMSL